MSREFLLESSFFPLDELTISFYICTLLSGSA